MIELKRTTWKRLCAPLSVHAIIWRHFISIVFTFLHVLTVLFVESRAVIAEFAVDIVGFMLLCGMLSGGALGGLTEWNAKLTFRIKYSCCL